MKTKSILDYIESRAGRNRHVEGERLSYSQWCDIRRNGTPEEIEEAVERMMQQGGYENLE